ncbi:universal stress protein [Streptomyces sp. NBC_01304]|uniref:universal stress protein n=1 Tax=Streptomyces sp. NBC_01304 TaxID=2903818 RepID=UPI002E150D6B|nr:universal stress protein [Streptomyces sp. NBC_01304]
MIIRRVTVGVDGSLNSVRALDRAAEEAARRTAALEIVYAVPDLDVAGPVLVSAAARVRARHPGLPITTLPVAGNAAAVLATRARDATLTVVGCRSFGGLAGAAFGSVSRRLASFAGGPLLVVRGDGAPRPYGEVLLVLDREPRTGATAYALEEAELRGAWLRTLRTSAHQHVVPVPMAHERLGSSASRLPADDASARAAGEPQPRALTKTRQATGAPQTLLEATRTADVVVIARRHGAGARGRQLGSVAHTLLHRSHCPVLIVPVTERRCRV